MIGDDSPGVMLQRVREVIVRQRLGEKGATAAPTSALSSERLGLLLSKWNAILVDLRTLRSSSER